MQTGHELNITFYANLESIISPKCQAPGVLSVVLTLASLTNLKTRTTNTCLFVPHFSRLCNGIPILQDSIINRNVKKCPTFGG